MKRLLLFLAVLAVVAVVWATASSNVSVNCSVSGLGSAPTSLNVSFSGTDPNAVMRGYRMLADVNTAETLDLGDISTIGGILIAADLCDVIVDCNYFSAFKESIYITEGECAYFKPAGPVQVRNPYDTTYTPIYEYIAFGNR